MGIEQLLHQKLLAIQGSTVLPSIYEFVHDNGPISIKSILERVRALSLGNYLTQNL